MLNFNLYELWKKNQINSKLALFIDSKTTHCKISTIAIQTFFRRKASTIFHLVRLDALETCTGTNSSTLTLPYPSGRVGVLYPEPAKISNGLISLAQISANASVTKRFVSAGDIRSCWTTKHRLNVVITVRLCCTTAHCMSTEWWCPLDHRPVETSNDDTEQKPLYVLLYHESDQK